MKTVYLLELKKASILDQLRIEEALLRSNDNNWCVINEGSNDAVVMGISGKPELLLNQNKILTNNVPVIKRFSGGGTVVVDHNTLFVSFIFNRELVNVPLYPEPLLRWTENFYQPVFDIPNFSLRENDYVLGNKKFGGNAQYIRKNRWLHHSTLLWDYDTNKMDYLLLPKKRPQYRLDRSHTAFLTSLKQYFPSREYLLSQVKKALLKQFIVKKIALEDIQNDLKHPHRKSTQLI